MTMDLYLYGAIREHGDFNFDTWDFDESETSAKYVKNQIENLTENDELNIYINSLGGSVVEGNAIYNLIRRCKAKKTAYIDGFACSIASVIAIAADKLVMPVSGVMMIHNAWTTISGNSAELRKTADELDVLNETIAEAYADKAGNANAVENFKSLMNEETYLTAKKCQELGICDEIDSRIENTIKSAENLDKKQHLNSYDHKKMNIYSSMFDKAVAMATHKIPEKKEEIDTANKMIDVFSSFFNLRSSIR